MPGRVKVWLLISLSAFGTFAIAECPKGDLTGDCEIDFRDVEAFAAQWLFPSSSPADLDGLNGVEARDLAVLADDWLQAGIPLVINEVMASNSNTNTDPQGQYDDWIEIYNAGHYAIDTGGMHLTDELGNPTKWQIPTTSPSATTIQPGGHLLIWADGDVTAPSGLHASFELNADNGDEVGLYDVNGVYIDSIEFPDQAPDISYGRYPDGNDTLRFFAAATPWWANTDAYIGQVADTKFSHDRGFYYSPFTVRIVSETDGAKVYYTLDGSSPFDLNADVPTGTLYTGGISVTTTTCLRAVAVKNGWKHTNIDAQTYIFPNDVLKQATNPSTGAQVVPAGYPTLWDNSRGAVVTGDYQIDPDIVNHSNSADRLTTSDLLAAPTVSLIAKRGDFFDLTGIYLNEELTYIVDEATEKAVSVEVIDPVRGESVQANCAIAMAGGATGGGTSLDRWKSYKLSMRPRFKTTLDNGTYTGGPAQLEFKVFADSPVEQFDTFVFDAVLNHSWVHTTDSTQRNTAIYIQDQYMSDLHNSMGGYSPHGIHGYLYFNGLHWGMYYFHERPDHTWAAEVFGGDADEYDAIKHGSDTVNDSFGVAGHAFASYNAMLNAASAVQSYPTNAERYATLCQMLDVDNLITYLISNWYGLNTDWPHKNWYATCRNHPEGRWRYHTWDAEHAIDKSWSTSTAASVFGNSPSDIHNKLKGNSEYLMRFADIIHKQFYNNGAMAYPNTANLYISRMGTADRAILAESARWGDNSPTTPYTRSNWLTTQNDKLNNFFPLESSRTLDYLKSMGLYPSVAAPEFRINDSYRHGGYISSSDLFSINGGTTLYYTTDGNDPRVPAQVDPGVTIVIARETADKYVLVPTGAISDDWKDNGDFDDSQWTYVTGEPGGVGYERSSGYEDYFTLDVEDEMYETNNSCYIRIPFVFRGDASAYDSLTLKVRYDDGFVAYINGTENEIARRNFTGTPAWDSGASSTHTDSLAIQLEIIDVSWYLSLIQPGENVLAIHAMNNNNNQSDFLISVELEIATGGGASGGDVSDSAMQYAGPMTFSRSTQVRSRVKSGAAWSALNEATYAVGPVAESIRISEIMYHPEETGDPNDPNEEFIELTNVGSETINLSLVSFTNGIDFTFGNVELGVGDYVVIVKNEAAFAAAHEEFSGVVAGEYAGSLNNGGERIELKDAMGQTILDFSYEDGWRDITDWGGYSLTIINPADSEPNTQDSWRASAYIGGSPGWDDNGIVPNPGAIVINEVMAHSHGDAPDWIELYNTTGVQIDIGGWYLSDSEINLNKYRLADGTKIDAYDYLLLYEDANFGEGSSDPGRISGFGFSENGDAAYLTSAEADVLMGYREAESFGASYTGISFGRYYKISTGNYNFVAMDHNTPDGANAYPKVGPIVINEIMYNPDWPAAGIYGNDRYEYVELKNISGEAVSLWREDKLLPWKFSEGIDYVFPAWPDEATIGAGDYIVVVKDVNAFTERYPSVPAEKIFGPYEGQLSDGGEELEISMPGDKDRFGRQHYIRIDRVTYSDGTHDEDVPGGVDLWPSQADGGGDSLSRIAAQLYGNDPNNWTNAAPSPGN